MDTSVTSPQVAADAGAAVIQWWMRLDTEAGYHTGAVEWSRNGTD
jgi:hypothetical protein